MRALPQSKTPNTRGFTKRFTRKNLQSRSATASLLIKINRCMKEEIKLILVLAQKSRHIVETCWRKQKRLGMGTVEKDVLLILYVINIAQVTGAGTVTV